LVHSRDENGDACWQKPSDFVWDSPSFLRCKKILKRSHGLRDIAAISLLEYKLGITNAGLTEFIEDLRIFKRARERDLGDLKNLYRHIELNIQGRENDVR
jgi:hypothetical protein